MVRILTGLHAGMWFEKLNEQCRLSRCAMYARGLLFPHAACLQDAKKYLFHVPRNQRHELVQIVEAEHGPKLEATNVFADARQTVLRAKMIEHILPTGIVVEFGAGHRAIVNDEILPDARHVERTVPATADEAGVVAVAH